MTNALVTQAGVETLLQLSPAALVTQAGVEALVTGNAGARVTQLGLEVLVSAATSARFTQAGVEVLIPKGGGLRSVPLSFKIRTRSLRPWPLTGSFRITFHRSVALLAQTSVGRRTVALSTRIVAHGRRSVPLTTRIQHVAQTRTIPLAGKLGKLAQPRTVAVDTRFKITSARSLPLSGAIKSLFRAVPLTGRFKRFSIARTIALTGRLQKFGIARTVALTAAPIVFRKTRTVPLTGRIANRRARSVPLKLRVLTHNPRLVRFSAVIGGKRSIPLTTRLKRSQVARTVPLTGRLKRTSSRTVPLTARFARLGIARTVALLGNVTRNVVYVVSTKPTSLVGLPLPDTSLVFIAGGNLLDPATMIESAAITTARNFPRETETLVESASVAAQLATTQAVAEAERASATGADTVATLGEAQSISAAVKPSDAASLQETTTNPRDTAAATEAATVSSTINPTEPITETDALSITVADGGDGAVVTDTASIGVTGTDTGTLTDDQHDSTVVHA